MTIPDETFLTSYNRCNNLELFYILSKKIRVRERESESMPLSPKIAFLVTLAADTHVRNIALIFVFHDTDQFCFVTYLW